MTDEPKVSILMPSLNVVKYIAECLDSVIAQTLQEIEILCIDAGSTDGTLEIIEEYAQKDPRIKLIHSDRKSYGYQMNLGLDAAQSDYIGIVETDDWIEPDMFETLYKTAVETGADIVKTNYYLYYTTPRKKTIYRHNLDGCVYDRLTTAYERNNRLFSTNSFIWVGLYKLSFLNESHIRFNETPGASFQDNSFHLMTCAAAEKIYMMDRAFYHYRKDNEDASTHATQSNAKIYCMCDEMHYYEEYIREYGRDKEYQLAMFMPLKYAKYVWNLKRIAPDFRHEYVEKMRDEFLAHKNEGLLHPYFFGKKEWDELASLLRDPSQFIIRIFGKNTDPAPVYYPGRLERAFAMLKNTVGKTGIAKKIRQDGRRIPRDPDAVFSLLYIASPSADPETVKADMENVEKLSGLFRIRTEMITSAENNAAENNAAENETKEGGRTMPYFGGQDKKLNSSQKAANLKTSAELSREALGAGFDAIYASGNAYDLGAAVAEQTGLPLIFSRQDGKGKKTFFSGQSKNGKLLIKREDHVTGRKLSWETAPQIPCGEADAIAVLCKDKALAGSAPSNRDKRSADFKIRSADIRGKALGALAAPFSRS